jgi:hypothetical protein
VAWRKQQLFQLIKLLTTANEMPVSWKRDISISMMTSWIVVSKALALGRLLTAL